MFEPLSLSLCVCVFVSQKTKVCISSNFLKFIRPLKKAKKKTVFLCSSLSPSLSPKISHQKPPPPSPPTAATRCLQNAHYKQHISPFLSIATNSVPNPMRPFPRLTSTLVPYDLLPWLHHHHSCLFS